MPRSAKQGRKTQTAIISELGYQRLECVLSEAEHSNAYAEWMRRGMPNYPEGEESQ